jgi:flagellar hook assembly protein FlgD
MRKRTIISRFQPNRPESQNELSGKLGAVHFDVNGRLVTTLDAGHRGPGYYQIPWSGTEATGRPVVPGMYFVRLDAAGNELTQKVVLVR